MIPESHQGNRKTSKKENCSNRVSNSHTRFLLRFEILSLRKMLFLWVSSKCYPVATFQFAALVKICTIDSRTLSEHVTSNFGRNCAIVEACRALLFSFWSKLMSGRIKQECSGDKVPYKLIFVLFHLVSAYIHFFLFHKGLLRRICNCKSRNVQHKENCNQKLWGDIHISIY